MSLGNFVIAGGAVWQADHLELRNSQYVKQYLISENFFVPGTNNAFSISIALKYISTYASGDVISAGQDYYSVFNIKSYRNNFYFQTSAIEAFASTPITNNTNYVLDFTYDGTTYKAYVNGQLLTYKTGRYITSYVRRVSIGCGTNGAGETTSHGDNLDIYAVNIYDRALTPEEIETNFNTYNERFNLGL